MKTARLAWPQFQILFLSKCAAWHNLIEPWWKQLHSLALKGNRFATKADLAKAVTNAVCYWNSHKHPYPWKKKPQQPDILLCGFASSPKSKWWSRHYRSRCKLCQMVVMMWLLLKHEV